MKEPRADRNDLRLAVETLHHCRAVYRRTEQVQEVFRGEEVWNGEVAVFSLEGHPSAELCYAWAAPVKDSKRLRFFAVLHEGPVESAQDAVRASIVQAYREETKDAH